MTTIGFIRHGITEWNELGKSQGIIDIPLNSTGKQQAVALAHRLALEEEWDMIAVSPLTRARETAQIIADKLNLPITVIDERIREINCGLIEGTTEEERIQRWGTNWRELNLGMEPRGDVSQRGIEFLEEIVQNYPGKRILVVSHGALIGLTLQRLMPETFSKTNMDNTSITILKNIERKWECILFNCTKHLELQ
ncbi:histidine phosphatase family protein [Neobacillus sp. D3-1R]|uniref:histidine phosphatase family protein n=1 Tax=Neobacillus sp. D3-1R TaxID=3445778 RepID=UPI003F9EDCEE